MSNNDQLILIDDSDEIPAEIRSVWHILIVDDDEEVHSATLLALRHVNICGRPLAFHHAYSAAEAEALLRQQNDIAVIFLDVVMESEDAGLKLVARIRNDLNMKETRIILRTGQPGYAPELSVIRDYDINDYKTKTDLTMNRLVTALTSAIRSYEQIQTISASKRGLSMIVESAAELFSMHALDSFAAGVLTQVAALLGLPPEGLLCARVDHHDSASADLVIIGAAGEYRELIHQPLTALHKANIVENIHKAITQQHNLYLSDATVLYFAGREGQDAAVYFDSNQPLNDIDRQLLEVFCVNIGVGLDNVNLFQNLEFHAYFDTLTRLPNRTGILRALDNLCSTGSGKKQCLALIDIEGFSTLNDALGHQKGDQLLLSVTERLRREKPEFCLLARISTDVFALLGPQADLSATTLHKLFAQPFAVGDYLFPVSVHLGLVDLDDSHESGLEILKDANTALNRAKKQHGPERFCLYNPSMTEEMQRRLELLSELHHTLTHRHGMSLHYQPQIDLNSNKMIGVEALLRWKRDNGEHVPPDQVIPLAERTGLIIDIGLWVLNTALAQLAEWHTSIHPNLCMAVNVSQAQFLHPDLVPTLKTLLRQYRLDPASVELEITETLAMQDPAATIAILQELKVLGIRVAIDDFGTGYSSLAHLQQLPIDHLKIDKSFVNGLGIEKTDTAIAAMIVQLGVVRGLRVIAEGIETDIQRLLLLEMGCHEGQGYLFAKPMPAEKLELWQSQQGVALP